MTGLSQPLKLTLVLIILGVLSLAAQAQNKPSEQKTGSVLVFPYYTSNDNSTADTLINISNVANVAVNVHLFFMEGTSCQQADIAVFLTPNGTITLRIWFRDQGVSQGVRFWSVGPAVAP